jgi:molecular chaperone GrpE
MNDQLDIEAILDRFRDWLEDARSQVEEADALERGSDSQLGPPEREFGIIDLVQEFTALRHELKLQTKSGRGLIDQTDHAVAALRQAIDQLRAVDAKEAQAVWSTGKALAEALADLDEAIARGQREVERARNQIADESVRALEASLDNLFRQRSWIRRRAVRSYHEQVKEMVRRDGLERHELFESFLEGYGLIQKRLRRAMASEQVTQIACEGRPVDPEVMTVLEVVEEPRDRPGTVVKELRRGYTWRGRVIRFAEVQVVRGSAKLQDAAEDEHALEMEPEEVEVEARPVQESRTGSTRAS